MTPGAGEVEIDVEPGGRVLVASDLHLPSAPTPASRAAADELARVLDAWAGPGALVLAGDVLELLAEEPADALAGLAAHPRFDAALRAFAARPDRRVVFLAGNHDARLAWDAAAQEVLHRAGMEVAVAVELVLETGAGPRRVRVEHGNRFDPANALQDPGNPAETPLGHHVVRELLPALCHRPWLAGIEALEDPGALPAFVASRLAYRRFARHLGWLAVPLLAALALRVPLAWELVHGGRASAPVWARRAVAVALAVAADLAVAAAVLAFVARRGWRSVGELAVVGAGDPNAAARDAARRLTAAGHAGLVTGHTHRPELAAAGDGFYANAGASSDVVRAVPTPFGLPPAYLDRRELSWVELEAGADLHVRLLHAAGAPVTGSWLERVLTRSSRRRVTGGTAGRSPARPAVVAAFPHGPSWPPVADPVPAARRVRRVAAAAIALAGVVDLASALTPPLRDRLHAIVGLVPLAVPQVAAALVALAGLGLLALARGIRRGQRHAWLAAVALLGGSVVLHLVKGADVEEAFAAAAVAAYLLRHRDAFRSAADRPSMRRGAAMLAAGGALAAALGALVAGTFGHLGPGAAIVAATERLAGVATVGLPERVADFLDPALAASGAGLLVAAGWLLFRPVVDRRGAATDRERARDIVRRHGRDSLAYFALRDDKRHFFWHDTVVAYAVYGGVCLVAPDPVGPPTERAPAWRAFHRFADEHGWSVAVMGAAAEWLPVYRETGMRDVYVGDEAVVDCRAFRLSGGDRKGLRQAVNRIANHGYTISFHTPASLPEDTRAALRDIMRQSRRGEVERGFSMTLGRAFDRADGDVLLAVAHDPAGRPAAFCQYVPAPGIGGYSLDLMRRSEGEHPNGLTDFVVVRTIEHLRDRGMRGLALNFATMRAVLAGEAGATLPRRIERWVLRRMSDSMQIESLWRYNAKFDPSWQPRYAVYDAPEHLLAAAVAVARAESFWELPVVGRFFVPAPPDGVAARVPDASR